MTTTTMFGVGQEVLLEGLRAKHAKTCAYTPADATRAARSCDCKFGITRQSLNSGEANGCPELRQAIAMVAAMTPTEFSMLAERAGIAGAVSIPKKRIIITCTSCGDPWDAEHEAGRCSGTRKAGG